MLGDGECSEGSVWEAMAFASHYNLDNLVAILDVNRLGQSEAAPLKHDMEVYRKRCEAFGSVSLKSQQVIYYTLVNLKKNLRPCRLLAQYFVGSRTVFVRAQHCNSRQLTCVKWNVMSQVEHVCCGWTRRGRAVQGSLAGSAGQGKTNLHCCQDI